MTGQVFKEFQDELDRLRVLYRDDPRSELLILFLTALEREELVSIGYRESLMVERLKSLRVSPDIREIIRHVLIWIWKDEEMHTIYIRGALLKLGNAKLRAEAFLHQAAGLVGGWAGSALQHTRWRQAPLSRTLAQAITSAGYLFGKLPAEVRQHLQYGPFRNFCLFNVDAEKTAWVCWERIAELTKSQPDLSAQLVRDFRRVSEDERKHAEIFQLLANVLDQNDSLIPTVTKEELVEGIRKIGIYFLPRRLRGVSVRENPLGSGGNVWCLKGDSPGDKRATFDRLLQESNLLGEIRERALFLSKPLSSMKVVIKPSFMLGYHRKDLSCITDVELLFRLARSLREHGCHDIAVVEGPNIYDRFYLRRSVKEVAAYFGIATPDFRLVDVSEEQVVHDFSRGMAQYTVSRTWKEADFRITFGKIRSHPIELAQLSVANVEWLGGRCDEYIFLDRQADRSTAIMMLLDQFPPHFALLEGYDCAPDGLVGMMGCPSPKPLLRLYAGTDALAVDTVAARHLGIKHPQQSSILKAASHWFGGWAERSTVVGCDEPVSGWRGPYHTEIWALLSLFAMPMYILGSGRGKIFVPEMDEEAFPSLEKVDWFTRMRRSALQWLLGLRH
ncbi:MAG: DUF362 domain-containing protein [Verrucomicrobiota bacterium]